MWQEVATNRILIINPNSSSSMTDALRQPVEFLGYNNTAYTYLTAPSQSPPSINDLATAADSSVATLPQVLPLIDSHDAFLVACYSPHPLVQELKKHTSKPVLGIFEASVSAALNLLGEGGAFGIVSTGEVWKRILEDAIKNDLLGADKAAKAFVGVETLGVDAGDLHQDGGDDEVKKKVMAATGRLIDSGNGKGRKINAILLGCAGMVGMDQWVKQEVQKRGKRIKVVDGVKAGVGILQGLLRAHL